MFAIDVQAVRKPSARWLIAFNLVDDALQGTVGHPEPDSSEEPIPVCADGLRQLPEGREPAVARPPDIGS